MSEQYAIWWVSAHDSVSISFDIDALFPEMPAYIVGEFHSLYGRNGRGRLWCASDIDIEEIEWKEDSIAGRYANKGEGMTAGGIVIHAKDIPFVRKLPGIITDLEMELI